MTAPVPRPEPPGFAPLEAKWSFPKVRLEPVFGGFLRVWRNGGKLAAPFVCAGAGAQGWYEIMLHSSISSNEEWGFIYKLLNVRNISGFREVEQSGVMEVAVWR